MIIVRFQLCASLAMQEKFGLWLGLAKYALKHHPRAALQRRTNCPPDHNDNLYHDPILLTRRYIYIYIYICVCVY